MNHEVIAETFWFHFIASSCVSVLDSFNILCVFDRILAFPGLDE